MPRIKVEAMLGTTGIKLNRRLAEALLPKSNRTWNEVEPEPDATLRSVRDLTYANPDGWQALCRMRQNAHREQSVGQQLDDLIALAAEIHAMTREMLDIEQALQELELLLNPLLAKGYDAAPPDSGFCSPNSRCVN